ncbi:hypothetical protein K3495_g2038 [Podosphaera aphanis]|nr:hypothetical protein K3495_g2038 [Podosphaera aphanis]
MTFIHPKALLALVFSPLVFAYPKITTPTAGSSIPGGTAFTVTWVDSGDAPAIADLTTYQLFLYSGGNANPQQLYSIANGAFSTGNSILATVPLTIGGSTPNAYFIGLVSTATAGGTVTSFSDRFTMIGMTGTFSAAVTTDLAKVTSSHGPKAINNVAAAANQAADGEDGPWATPYTLQTGLTKYAPMQPIPPTAITATNTKPLWPTSSVDIAKTYLPIPSQVTTLTQSQTFSAESHANTAAPASQPTNDMQKYLNRWKD